MTVRRITFEEPNLVEGSNIPNITVNGVTVTFLTRVAVFRPNVATASGVKALMNAGQAIYDETGFQKPIIFEFSQLQNRVRVFAGLNERDISTLDGRVTARLVAYDSSGREVGSRVLNLGSGPTPITNPLEVRAQSGQDVIRRVLLEYNGVVREVIDDFEFESVASTPIPRDVDPPVVTISQPVPGQQVNSPIITVSGSIRELNNVRLFINMTQLPVQRINAVSYHFSGQITLASGQNTIEAVATDEAGNTGGARTSVDVRIPDRFTISNVRFTQTGLFDPASPLPTRLVARKTGLFCVRLGIQTSDGRTTSVDSADIVVEDGQSSLTFSGQPRPSGTLFGGSGNYALADGQDAYFFINGRWLEPGRQYQFIIKLRVRQNIVYERTLVSNWSFQNIRGITMLLIPQVRPLNAAYTRALMEVLDNASRIFPVPDGVGNLGSSDANGGIRIAILPPTSYRNHTDPADNSLFGASVSYLQGFLLEDHRVAQDDGSLVIWSGEYLPIEFTHAEDENRNGTLDEEELAHVRGGESRESLRRFSMWGTFVRQSAESLRQYWNRFIYRYPAERAIAVVVGGGDDAQNRTGLGGNAGGGERTYWADIDAASNGFITHETGHTFFGPNHDEDVAPPTEISCRFPGEAINLLTRQIIDPAYSVMCPELAGGSSILFLHRAQYDMLFDRLVSLGGSD